MPNEKRQEYLFAVYFICGIESKYFVTLRWGDIDFEGCKIHIIRQMESRISKNIVELDRTEKVIIKESKMAFEFLKMEFEKQASIIGISQDTLLEENRIINQHLKTLLYVRNLHGDLIIF